MLVLLLKFILHQNFLFPCPPLCSHLLLMSLLSVNSACPKLTHPFTLEICLFLHIPHSVKGPAHLPSHRPLLPCSCLQYFPPFFSHSPFPFKVLNVPDLNYLKSLLNCLPSSRFCTTIICTMAWLIFLRHCFVVIFLLKNFLWVFIHSQTRKPIFLSSS